MRALATYEASAWPEVDASEGWATRKRAGLCPGHDGEIVRYVDPIESSRERPEGEDARGLPVRRHPLKWLEAEREARYLGHELRDGVIKELTPEDRETRSNAEFELLALFLAAKARHKEAREKAALEAARQRRGT